MWTYHIRMVYRNVNNGISSELCLLRYTRVDEVVCQLLQLGPGALIVKLDIKSVYRIVLVHPQDRFLLGMKWEDRVFVDRALPFGLRSAPKIFNAVADTLEWIVKDLGVQQLWHYLDDYITCGAPGSVQLVNVSGCLQEFGSPVGRGEIRRSNDMPGVFGDSH